VRRFVVVLALTLSMGLHWSALQTVAWTTMLLDFAQDHSLDEAVGMTFDGRHPCSLCCAIDAAKDDGDEDPASRPRLEFPKAIVPSAQALQPAAGPRGDRIAFRTPSRPLGVTPVPPRHPPRS